MFKIIALAGVLAGGAGYAAYEYTDLFGGKDGCPLSQKSCCSLQTQPVATTPSCCQTGAECCEVGASCCDTRATAKVVAKVNGCTDSCCSAKTTTVAAKVAACCSDPCLACALLACETCADCAACCGATNATVAVAGPAALVPAKAAK